MKRNLFLISVFITTSIATFGQFDNYQSFEQIDSISKVYIRTDDDVKANVFAEEEALWPIQKFLGKLFGLDSHSITYHLKEIYKSFELEENATTRKNRVVQKEGYRNENRELDFYKLYAIISVSYRVNSMQAKHFSILATKTLKEFIAKRFILDDERLKQGNQVFGKDNFDELLEKIRKIRATEKLFHQKVTDIFAHCSVNYNSKSETAMTYYKTVQNKLHLAIMRNTASEIFEIQVQPS